MENKDIERDLIKKYRKRIWSRFIEACKEYKLINENDVIGVCISGGKDSMLMAKCIQMLNKYSEVKFSAKYIVMDPGYTEANLKKIIDNANTLGIDIEICKSDIFQIVSNIDQSPCYLCARMRRGCLYRFAQERGCNKIALGHHFDDVIETTLMNILYSGQFKTMMPKLHSENYEGMEIIRPLYLIKEQAIINWAKGNDLSFIQCACRFTEEFHLKKEDIKSGHKREEMKALVEQFRKTSPFIEQNIFNCAKNVNLDKVLGYRSDKNGEYFFLDDYDDFS